MAKANQAVAPAQSALVVDTFNGQSVEAAQASIQDIGFGTQRAERAIVSGTADRDVLDNNLLHWVVQADKDGRLLKDGTTNKYVPIPYTQFIQVRDWYVGAAFDAGAETTDAAAKVWERAINRLVAMDFVRPKAESKDAKRMSEKAAKQAEAMAKFTDLELEAKRAELIEKGDSSSLREALTLAKELDKRAKPEIDKNKAEAKQLAELLRTRITELSKAATDDAISILTAMVMASK